MSSTPSCPLVVVGDGRTDAYTRFLTPDFVHVIKPEDQVDPTFDPVIEP
jgi:hypothetical protein